MRAEILSIGTEIMFGEITDTNAAYVASALPQFGIDLLWVTQVGDNPGRLREAFARAWERSDITFCTGGLGPTEDDITRETIAEMLGEPLALDPEQERVLRALFEARGVTNMPARNMKQASLIPSARAITNERGTAPGWWVERDTPAGKRVIVVMPGPPAEMHHMWDAHVAPELERRADSVLVARTLKTSGVGESAIDEMLSPLLSGTNPSIGIYARADGVSARIAAKAATREAAWALIRPVEAEARRILGTAIWGQDDDTLAGGVVRMLTAQGLTLGLMESASGGAIASAITDVEGASVAFRGSLVTYATDVKVAMGVPAEVPATHGVRRRRRWRSRRARRWAWTSRCRSPASRARTRSRASPAARCTSRSGTAPAWSTARSATTRAASRRSAASCSRRSPCCARTSWPALRGGRDGRPHVSNRRLGSGALNWPRCTRGGPAIFRAAKGDVVSIDRSSNPGRIHGGDRGSQRDHSSEFVGATKSTGSSRFSVGIRDPSREYRSSTYDRCGARSSDKRRQLRRGRAIPAGFATASCPP